MRAYVATSGTVFALLVLAHIARVFAEGLRVASNPWFIASTLAATVLCVWAFRLLMVSSRP